MPRPKLDARYETVQSGFRMPKRFWDEADALCEPYARKHERNEVTRTEILREALARGMRSLRKELLE